MVGMFLTGCFASQIVVGLDGYSTIPDRTVAERLKWQMLDAFMGFFYTFVVTLAILYGLKFTRLLKSFKRVETGRLILYATPQHVWREQHSISLTPQ
jgi:ammonia channel protein AmtB